MLTCKLFGCFLPTTETNLISFVVYVNRQDLQDNSLNQILCDFEFVDTDFSFLFIMNRQELSFKQRSLLFTVLLFRYSHLFVVNSIQSSFCRSINVWEHQFAIGQQLPCKIIRHIVSTCVVIIFIKCLEKCARRDWSERVHYISIKHALEKCEKHSPSALVSLHFLVFLKIPKCLYVLYNSTVHPARFSFL